MAGHTVTPYELTATRKWARKNKDEQLTLSSLGKDTIVDLLDVVEDNILYVDPSVSSDESRTVACDALRRYDDHLEMVFSCDVTGERESVHDGEQPGRPVVFTKNHRHVTRFYSCCILWRPDDGKAGLLLIHSPWGRGGSKANIMSVIQRALNQDDDAKANLRADAKIPPRALEEMLRRAEATRITYLRGTGVTSEFNRAEGKKSAPAQLALVVKGSDSVPFRNALTGAFRAARSREQLFTVSVRGSDGQYYEEEFDDVEIALKTAAGTKQYSLRDNTIPTMGYNLTKEINNVYYALPEDDHDAWAVMLMDGVSEDMTRLLNEVRRQS